MKWNGHRDQEKKQSFPEIDKAEWMTIPIAKEKIIEAQQTFLDELASFMSQGNIKPT